MIQSLWSAASGLQAQQLKVDTIANNLANVNTTGFKASRVVFQDLAYLTYSARGSQGTGTGNATTANGAAAAGPLVQVGAGVGPGTLLRDLTPGQLEATEQPFDLAIDGPGFFRVKLADGSFAYTRNGHFGVNRDRLLVDAAGNPVLTVGGQTITLPQDWTMVSIEPNGNVVALLANGTSSSVGQIGVAGFTNPAGLEAMGGGLYRSTAASGDARVVAPGASGTGQLRQGFLEGSNVQVVAEMVNLIVAQRAYELSAKAVQGADQMLEIANNLRR